MTDDSAERDVPFRPVCDLHQLEQVLRESESHPVLIFKHSVTCGISAMAHDALQPLGRADGVPPVYMVSVQSGRAVSDAIASRLGIRHESPQILLVVHRQVTWAASHYRVSAAEVGRAWSTHCAAHAR